LLVAEGLEIEDLLEVSARLGADPLLVQAATGNTSLKRDGVLWIKASGKWLAHADHEEILIPVELAGTRSRIERNIDPAGQSAVVNGKTLGTSVETAMHAVLPYRVVLHVHSVNAIAWAVRRDGHSELAARLAGFHWQWIPYVPSGLALARAVQEAVARAPQTDVLVLANHGLVICGDSCAEAEARLREFELRASISPRVPPPPCREVLTRLSHGTVWRAPQNAALHAIGSDPVSRRIVTHGVLYPCQAIFLSPQVCRFPGPGPGQAGQSWDDRGWLDETSDPFVVVEDAGILVRENPNPVVSATLAGLAQVLQRIPESAAIEYLAEEHVRALLCADVYHYREVVEDNSVGWSGSRSQQF
jgi:rhamnose utilization protein RhaD (predicted bifunctional aldolase and dehydrogenase)